MRACVLLLSVVVPFVASSCDRTCASDDDCAAGFACPTVPEECARRCAPLPLRGEACSLASDGTCADFALGCGDGLVCAERGDGGGTTGTCAPTEGRVLNETCAIDDECAASLVCATAATEGTVGGECAPSTGRGTDVPCDDDAQCASGVCVGAACE